MNYRLILATGLITSTLGATLGWGVGQMALRRYPSQMRTHVSQGYQTLYDRRLVWVGAIAGGLIGMGQVCVLQMKKLEDQD